MHNHKKIIRIPINSTGKDVDVSNHISIIDTPEFQRLNDLRQLPNIDIAFPSAMHTRKEHSIGAFYFAGLMADSLKLNPEKSSDLKTTALLHDITHPAYGHSSEVVLEDIFKISHDDNGAEKIKSLKGEIENSGADFSRITEIFVKKDPAWKLVWSQIGADKIDYTQRDFFHCMQNSVENDRIITYMAFDGSNFGVDEKASRMLKDYILNWHLAHTEIYLRPSVELSQGMFQRAEYHAIREGSLDPKDLWNMRDWELNANLSNSESETARKIFKRLCDRSLLKRAGVLKLEKYVDVERVAKKPIHVEGISSEEYGRIERKYNTLKDIVSLEEKMQNELSLGQDELIITTSPHIGRLKPKDVNIFSENGGNFKSLFGTYPSFERSLQEGMEAHYALRISVVPEKREYVCRRFKEDDLITYVL